MMDPTSQQPPVAPPPPPRVVTPQPALRTAGLVAVTLILLGIAYSVFPSVMAASIRNSFPTVHAVISGVTDGATMREGQSFTVTAANSSGSDLTYEWTFGDNFTPETGKTVTKTISQYTSNYNITLGVSDPLGKSHQSGHSDETHITVNILPPMPTASFTAQRGQAYVYAGIEFKFDASTSTGEQLDRYSWDFGDGNQHESFGPSVTHYYTKQGTFTVTLTITDIASQTATATQSVTVTVPKPVAAFTIKGGSFDYETSDASASTGAITTYHWDYGDGKQYATIGVSDYHTYSSAGTYVVTLTVTDAFGQTASVSHPVTVTD